MCFDIIRMNDMATILKYYDFSQYFWENKKKSFPFRQWCQCADQYC